MVAFSIIRGAIFFGRITGHTPVAAALNSHSVELIGSLRIASFSVRRDGLKHNQVTLSRRVVRHLLSRTMGGDVCQ